MLANNNSLNTKSANKITTLEKRVQELEDHIHRLEKTYNDLLYNLDDDNFSTVITKEKGDMKTSIIQTARDITLAAQDITEIDGRVYENTAEINVNAAAITSKVSETDVNSKLENYSTRSQTAQDITDTVGEVDEEGNLVNYSTKTQTANAISTTIMQERTYSDNIYETQEYADQKYDAFESSISQNATAIEMKVSANYVDPIRISGIPGDLQDKSRMYYNYNNDKFYYWDSSWKETSDNSPYSYFKQTIGGFKLKGDFETLTGANGRMTLADTNLKVFGQTIEELPKLQLGYVKSGATEYPQLILGAGSRSYHDKYGHAPDQVMVQKVVGGGNIGYKNTDDIHYMIQFDSEGVNFSNAGNVRGLDIGSVYAKFA